MSRTTVCEEYSITQEEYSRHVREYWRVAAESDGFDIDEYRCPVVLRGLVPFHCGPKGIRHTYKLMLERYVLLGLHRYNILQGTNFKLDAVQKCISTMSFVSSYYFTLLAHDPAAIPPFQQTFQVKVDEMEFTVMDLAVSIARPKKVVVQNQDEAAVTPKEPFVPHFDHRSAVSVSVSDGVVDGVIVFQGRLPDWPSDHALNDDRNRFYVLKESEWQTTDWISLYLELLICATDRGMFGMILQTGLPKLHILKVVIETEEEDQKPPDERLNAKRAHVYITFKGLAKSPPLADHEIGDHVERKAIIRRVIDAHSGCLTLQGSFWSDKDAEHRSKRLRTGGPKRR
ncbi:PREDICTED: LOW QUALITY PROTEIN: putative UPF0725 protein At1g28500 [Camelina sativa]|uniref:LOW QUALITY PROTEIN: putative UPF0725 protein At1g28500 n=1 Tax=Camelina sativa TaxID=90675 RepID=A0ABM0X4T4_CAMSA|nr:PREDICTED: LOW QUALITY PROTEIN: putative UPF0725 protein At1g28500 [Camelina sativa]